MAYEIRTCASCGNREPMDLSTDVRFAGEFGPLCDDCLPLALRTMEANTKDNADPAPDPALLALARLGAKLFDRAWIKSVGFVNEGGLQDDLDRDTVAFGLVRYEAPGDFQMAPGIADAIARLLAPDGAGEVAP